MLSRYRLFQRSESRLEFKNSRIQDGRRARGGGGPLSRRRPCRHLVQDALASTPFRVRVRVRVRARARARARARVKFRVGIRV